MRAASKHAGRAVPRRAGRSRSLAAWVAPLILALAGAAAAEPASQRLPAPGGDGWRPLALPRVQFATRYERVTKDGREALRATSDCSASAFVFGLDDVDLRRTPRLRWRWRIERGLDIPNERVKAGDDFAARVYLLFPFDPSRASVIARARHALGTRLFGDGLPGHAINYVWTSREPAGARWDNPFAADSKMISLGRGPLTGWREEEVDVAADYRALFAEEPRRVMGLAVMTDSDNSCQRAEALFADFELRGPQPPPSSSPGAPRDAAAGRPRETP